MQACVRQPVVNIKDLDCKELSRKGKLERIASVKNCSSVCKEAGTHDWISRVACGCKPPDRSTVPHMPEVEASHQLFTTRQKSQAGQVVCSRLELATQPSREVKPPEHPIWQNMTFHIPSHLTIYIPLYPRFKERF